MGVGNKIKREGDHRMEREREREGDHSMERERERGVKKRPIMLCRIADRGLLFGYLGNKMLSLYEDWRDTLTPFSLSSTTIYVLNNKSKT